MEKIPLPEMERRGEAVRLACHILRSTGTRVLPPDPVAMAKELELHLMTMTEGAKLLRENPDSFIRHSTGAEAFTLSAGRNGEYFVFYDDTVRSPERIRFSIFHEYGHILMRHFLEFDVMALTADEARVLEDEANTFARNLLCPLPILDMVRGDRESPKWAAFFCMSERAWKTRIRTLPIDRRYINQETADRLRDHFREYMYGRRCRECGEVFIDDAGLNRCPVCGSRYLLWNPEMESREEAVLHEHAAGATAEDLRPRVGEDQDTDLTRYWEMLKKQSGQRAGHL